MYGFPMIVEFLVKIPGVDINMGDNLNATALWLAAGKGHLDVVKVLVENQADLI